eukprot:CAMPEP_0198323990 /NCGR_PEP_ID=MMETSP1450-20131203/12089_1 /TAXON_ID=753684 ORGANISM="Madagascaria erythrocladiodes, Strain CCMP3234" /NCGR_SAMPLE_ID=MMETSP1450 /ASSEMBLY_ACC=CAM_ASM_001115 /LENGTH=190 /DNA_ID=CAMNT_0044027741 /DNA_START=44 /DNA_END=616 /DNA_ORIENTATION=-
MAYLSGPALPSGGTRRAVSRSPVCQAVPSAGRRAWLVRHASVAAAAAGAAVLGGRPRVSEAADKPKQLVFETTESGLRVADVEKGRGAYPQTGDLVIVKYVGYLHDGTVFDNTDTKGRKPIAFQVGQGRVIKAWDEAILGMRPGGKRKIIAPPELAYGSRGICIENECLVPPNETLEFDLTLVRVAPTPI